MVELLIAHYGHFWRTYEKIVADFRPHPWIYAGYGCTTPARLSFHIIESTRYYIQDSSALIGATAKEYSAECKNLLDDQLPNQEDILLFIHVYQRKTEQWLINLDGESENTDFPWTGKNKASVALFLLRHSQFHLGEMSALLNEQEKGKAPDHYVETLNG